MTKFRSTKGEGGHKFPKLWDDPLGLFSIFHFCIIFEMQKNIQMESCYFYIPCSKMAKEISLSMQKAVFHKYKVCPSKAIGISWSIIEKSFLVGQDEINPRHGSLMRDEKMLRRDSHSNTLMLKDIFFFLKRQYNIDY